MILPLLFHLVADAFLVAHRTIPFNPLLVEPAFLHEIDNRADIVPLATRHKHKSAGDETFLT